MSFEIKQITVNSTDNIHTLVGKIYIPEGEIKGMLHTIHGMTEHIERYDHIMSAAAEKGYVAFGYDHLGHGKTARDDSELGFIAHSNGWKYLVNDVKAFNSVVQQIYPDKPLYLFGHSMGSFIARLALVASPESYKKAIICGTAGKNPLAPIGLLLTDIIKLLKGEKHISKTINNIAFGAYNRRFEGISKYDWLTKDRDIIEKYSEDKFCNFSFTVSAMHDLMNLINVCNKPAWFKEVNAELPILLIAGECDPVGNYGKGVTEVYNRLKKENRNVTLKLYEDCRHEILNDTCRQEVISDILNFIK